jgi:caa(3)-type oxidase subunit IV
MSESHVLSVSTYVVVLAILVILTFLTVGISFVPLAGLWHLAFGLAIAGCKGALVVLFFMHAVQSPRVTWVVIVVTLFWLVAVLLILTLSDYFTRGMIPFMPGH